mmetsp:Transcript_12282/g.14073  ORF Transcript_12282/g.14073 Transcript_12282/m.14073 type:complete len:223 (-) Transcript_12282:115-783(-)
MITTKLSTHVFCKKFQRILPILPTAITVRSLQDRCFSSRLKKRKGIDDPFKILRITEETSYANAKKSFIKIAMKNHPDTAGVEDEADRDRLRDVFIRAREAFEKLVEAPDGSIMLQEEADLMPDFDQWFRHETGHDNPFDLNLDPETMKEVAEMTDEMGGGLARDGGMWQLAKMVTNAHKDGGDAGSILKLEGGKYQENEKAKHVDGVLRRRQRNNRQPRRK